MDLVVVLIIDLMIEISINSTVVSSFHHRRRFIRNVVALAKAVSIDDMPIKLALVAKLQDTGGTMNSRCRSRGKEVVAALVVLVQQALVFETGTAYHAWDAGVVYRGTEMLIERSLSEEENPPTTDRHFWIAIENQGDVGGGGLYRMKAENKLHQQQQQQG